MITLYNGVNFEDNTNFEALEKELKEKLERSEDFGGDLYLELAECLRYVLISLLILSLKPQNSCYPRN